MLVFEAARLTSLTDLLLYQVVQLEARFWKYAEGDLTCFSVRVVVDGKVCQVGMYSPLCKINFVVHRI
jgi:hypothetical protein